MDINTKAQQIMDGALLVNMPYDKTRHFTYINMKAADVIKKCISEIKTDMETGVIPKNDSAISDNFYLYNKIIDTINGNENDTKEVSESSQKYHNSIKEIINKHLKNAKILDKVTGSEGNKKVLLETEQVEELKLLVIQLIEQQNGPSEDLSIEKWKINQSVSATYKEYAKEGIDYFNNFDHLSDDIRNLVLRTDRVTLSSRLRAKYIDGIPDPTNPKEKIYARFDKECFVTVTNDPLKESTMAFQVIKIDKPTPSLNIVFRGTDTNAEGIKMINYLSDDYFSMEKQYDKMAPIIEDVIKYQLIKHNEKYGNEPLTVNFAGHSLGAAFAEIALKKNQDREYKFNDFVYNGNELAKMEHGIDQQVNFTSTSFNLPPIVKTTPLTKLVGEACEITKNISNKYEKFSFVGKSAVSFAAKFVAGVVAIPVIPALGVNQQFANFVDRTLHGEKVDERGQIIQVQNDVVNIAKRLSGNNKTSEELTFNAGGKGSAMIQHDARYIAQMVKECLNDGKVSLDSNGNMLKGDSSIISYLKNRHNDNYINKPIEISDELKNAINEEKKERLQSLKNTLLTPIDKTVNFITKTKEDTVNHIGNLIGKMRTTDTLAIDRPKI